MEKRIRLTEKERNVFETALAAMAGFKRTFGRALEPGFVAELHVALQLDLELVSSVNAPGYDAVGSDGKRYQIKYRSTGTQNVDVNNFEFDELILVNLDEEYQPTAMWRITVDHTKQIFTLRADHRKYQARQDKIKQIGERIV